VKWLANLSSRNQDKIKILAATIEAQIQALRNDGNFLAAIVILGCILNGQAMFQQHLQL